jgi:hypothetical protein
MASVCAKQSVDIVNGWKKVESVGDEEHGFAAGFEVVENGVVEQGMTNVGINWVEIALQSFSIGRGTM